mmetsp:Transcript_1769/g.3115  ORF Transcript_1769/g.3115 Transcript_1769/m.3115 type:complete len:210 (-) Transcript_1769:893-1522(-)
MQYVYSQNKAMTGTISKPPLSPAFLSRMFIGIHTSETSIRDKHANKKDTNPRQQFPRCCTIAAPTLQATIKMKVLTRVVKGTLAHSAKCFSAASASWLSSSKKSGICRISNGAVPAIATCIGYCAISKARTESDTFLISRSLTKRSNSSQLANQCVMVRSTRSRSQGSTLPVSGCTWPQEQQKHSAFSALKTCSCRAKSLRSWIKQMPV